MSASEGFQEFLKDQLAGFGPLTIRRMFGGAGVYADSVMFGLIADDTLPSARVARHRGLDDPPEQHEDHPDREIGNGMRVGVRSIGDEDPCLGRGIDVGVVYADSCFITSRSRSAEARTADVIGSDPTRMA